MDRLSQQHEVGGDDGGVKQHRQRDTRGVQSLRGVLLVLERIGGHLGRRRRCAHRLGDAFCCRTLLRLAERQLELRDGLCEVLDVGRLLVAER
eukprot:5722439-Prymnesium_polylepis.2